MARKSASSAKAISLHIGLNGVSAAAYSGWDGPLAACEFDAHDMAAIAKSKGMKSTVLLTKKATRAAALAGMRGAAKALKSGDLFFMTYSGHGGQMADPWGLSPTVDTWCVFDRQIIGHELGLMWSSFRPGCRILVLSDSCHSGEVTREWRELAVMPAEVAVKESGAGIKEGEVVHAVETREVVKKPPVQKNMPAEIQALVEVQHRYLYRSIWKGLAPPVPACPVLLISGCQSNQLSSDGASNGLYTEKVLLAWNNGKFNGDHPAFHKAIVGQMPPWQTPNLFMQSPNLQDDVTTRFLASKPFTI